MGSWQRIAAVLLFAAGQFLSVVHAASFGDEPHEHDCVVCAAVVAEDDERPILPPTALDVAVPLPEPSAILVPEERSGVGYDTGFRPPPTGPPALTN